MTVGREPVGRQPRLVRQPAPPLHPATIEARDRLASVYQSAGKMATALRLDQESSADFRTDTRRRSPGHSGSPHAPSARHRLRWTNICREARRSRNIYVAMAL